MSESDVGPSPSRPPAAPDWLLGRWRLLRADPSLTFAPGVTMEFHPAGRLSYGMEIDGRPTMLEMVYRAEDGTLTTNSPASGHSAVTRFRLGEGDVLVIDFSGAIACFVREQVT